VTGHLIHIGYPKTGSNFLRRWFEAHPELAFARRGIAGFQDVYEIARQSAAPAEGIRYRVTSGEALATPDERVGRARFDYGDGREQPMGEGQARVCETLAALFPDAHILVVTRGFRAMIMSAYSQYVRTGGMDSFETFYRPDARSAARWRETWDYDHLLALYRAAFPGRVIAFPYELLRDDPAAFTQALADRLDIAHCDPPAARPNASLSPAELAWYPRLTRFVRALPGPLRRRVEGRYFHRARANQLGGTVALLQRLRPKPPITDALITADLARSVWGTCESLRGDPLYAPYLKEYLQ
jgi:hypothetical protein